MGASLLASVAGAACEVVTVCAHDDWENTYVGVCALGYTVVETCYYRGDLDHWDWRGGCLP